MEEKNMSEQRKIIHDDNKHDGRYAYNCRRKSCR